MSFVGHRQWSALVLLNVCRTMSTLPMLLTDLYLNVSHSVCMGICLCVVLYVHLHNLLDWWPLRFQLHRWLPRSHCHCCHFCLFKNNWFIKQMYRMSEYRTSRSKIQTNSCCLNIDWHKCRSCMVFIRNNDSEYASCQVIYYGPTTFSL